MEFTLDYFVAELRRPKCGAVSGADESTHMVTYIRKNPQLAHLGVGHSLELDLPSLNQRGYLTVKMPGAGEDIHILHPCECPTCGPWPLWAEIVVRNGVIESISNTSLTRETLARANSIQDEAKGVAATLIGMGYADLEYEETVPLLRTALLGDEETEVESKRLALNNNRLPPANHGRSQGQQPDRDLFGLFKTH